MTFRTAMELGRVSNLPTIWTNVLAAVALSGHPLSFSLVAVLAGAYSLFYVGGMYLNDAFDAEWDQRNKPERPIPSGEVSERTVYILGILMLAGGVLALTWVAINQGVLHVTLSMMPGVVLALTIVFYDAFHKAHIFAPFLMGLIRGLVYITVGMVLTGDKWYSLFGIYPAAALTLYVAGLTVVARQETLASVRGSWSLLFLATPLLFALPQTIFSFFGWLMMFAYIFWMVYSVQFLRNGPAFDIPTSVMSLIAGISLVDSLFLVKAGYGHWFGACIACFLLTVLLQRIVRGT